MDKDFLDLILEKQDKISADIIEIKVIQGKQQVSLDEHVKRSNGIEESNKLFRQEMEPVKTHVKHVEGALKFIGLISISVGIISGVLTIIKYL